MDADQENVVSAVPLGSLCKGICTVLVGAGVTWKPRECLSVLRSLPAVGEFLAPLVKEFAMSGSHGFSGLFVVIMRPVFIQLEGRAWFSQSTFRLQ